MMRFIGTVFVIIILLLSSLSFSLSSYTQIEKNNEGWGQYGHDAQHTWRIGYEGLKNRPQILEKRKINVDSMLLYKNYLIVSTTRAVIVFDADDFREVTKFGNGGEIAVYKGRVYVRSGNSLSAYTLHGKKLWEVNNVSGNVIQLSKEGIFLYYGSYFPGFACWIYWISFWGEIKKKWLINHNVITAEPAIFEGRLYVPARNVLYVINLTDNSMSNISSIFRNDEMIRNVAIDNDGTIYILTIGFNYSTNRFYSRLYAIDKGGHKKWVFYGDNYQSPRNKHGITLVGNKHLYLILLSTDHSYKLAVVQLNKSDGNFEREIKFNNSAGYTQAFVDSSDTLYLIGGSCVYSYSSDGKLNWKIEMDKYYISFEAGQSLFGTAVIPYGDYIYLRVVDKYADKTYIYKLELFKNESVVIIIISAVMLMIAVAGMVSWKKHMWKGRGT